MPQDEVRAAITLDQFKWEIGETPGGDLGLVRHRWIDDYIYCVASVGWSNDANVLQLTSEDSSSRATNWSARTR